MASGNRSGRVCAMVAVAIAGLALGGVARGDVVIGDWENQTDGWLDWGGGQGEIAAPKFTYVTGQGVTHGSTALKLTQTGWGQNLSVKLWQIGHQADFFTNKKFQMDVTIPASDTDGWTEIYQFVINADGYGFTQQTNVATGGTNPYVQWGWPVGGAGEQHATLEVDYSALVDGDPNNGEILPSASYVEFVIATNNDGVAGHDVLIFDDARLVSGAPPHVTGDTNGDGVVDLGDLNNVLNNFGSNGAGNVGDENHDNVVDLQDLNNVLNNFGAHAAAAALAVPEPGTLSVLGAGLVAMGGRRRK